jgi:hypothetical protein
MVNDNREYTMTILQQAVWLSTLREIKDRIVNGVTLARFIKERKSLSYYHLIMVSIEPSGMILDWQQIDSIAETLWHLFPDELADIYKWVDADDRPHIPVPDSLKRCFAEAREMAKIRNASFCPKPSPPQSVFN